VGSARRRASRRQIVAVIDPKPTHRDQLRMGIGIAVTAVVGIVMVGVVGPILLAIIVGEIWGH